MQNTNAVHKILIILATVAVPRLALPAVILRKYIFALTESLPECWINKTTGLLCPACGNTRSIKALLSGHIIKSAGYNITPLVLCVIGIMFYIELVTLCAGRHFAVFPRSNKFVVALIAVLFLYYILRNVFPVLTMC